MGHSAAEKITKIFAKCSPKMGQMRLLLLNMSFLYEQNQIVLLKSRAVSIGLVKLVLDLAALTVDKLYTDK